jgi:hypothetical protein
MDERDGLSCDEKEEEEQTQGFEKQVRLTIRGMFETAVGDGADQLGLQEEIAESGRMDTNIAALLVGGSGISLLSVAVGGGLGRGGVGLDLVVRVVNEILLVRHVGGMCEEERRWRGP